MLTCKAVSKSLQSGDYRNLPRFKRILLKLHVALCFICGRYNKQVMQMQDMCHEFRTESQKHGENLKASLGQAKKQELALILEKGMAEQRKSEQA